MSNEEQKVNENKREKMSFTKGWTPANTIQMCMIILCIYGAYIKADQKIKVHATKWDEQKEINNTFLETLKSHDDRMDQDDIDDAVEKQISLGMADDISRVRVLFEQLMNEKKEL